KACDPLVHEWWSVTRGYVRPQANFGEVRRSAFTLFESRHRATDRRGIALAIQVSKVWREWHRGERALPARRPVHRRHRRGSLDARRRAEPRAIAIANELRRRATHSPQRGVVGYLRAGKH